MLSISHNIAHDDYVVNDNDTERKMIMSQVPNQTDTTSNTPVDANKAPQEQQKSNLDQQKKAEAAAKENTPTPAAK